MTASPTSALEDGLQPKIERMGSTPDAEAIAQLVFLLEDTVESGASVGFLAPMPAGAAAAYWQETFAEAAAGKRFILSATLAGRIVGSVQLELASKPNGRHRAEVQKLLVLRSARRQGLGRALMTAVEELARRHGRTLLLLDTRKGDAAEGLYIKLGYIAAGVVPRYAVNSSGGRTDSVVFYKELSPEPMDN